MRKHRIVKLAAWLVGLAFVGMNIIAFLHAYSFTHFSDERSARTKDPKELSYSEKIKILFTGINNPRPYAQATPASAYKTILLEDPRLGCWSIVTPGTKGTVILFHGYAGEKSSLLGRADEFLKLGYNALLVDFKGSGESEGNSTTIGFDEAAQVKKCYDFLKESGETHVYLFGTSMGSVAILKSIDHYSITPDAIILECPFGSLYKTVRARFELMGVPSFPMAELLTFWGGVQNGYWAFGHNPAGYATSVQCPTLLLYGAQDERVTREEIDLIYSNLGGLKTLKVYEDAGHNVFKLSNQEKWSRDVAVFFQDIK